MVVLPMIETISGMPVSAARVDADGKLVADV
jgi:hypothetical protein